MAGANKADWLVGCEKDMYSQVGRIRRAFSIQTGAMPPAYRVTSGSNLRRQREHRPAHLVAPITITCCSAFAWPEMSLAEMMIDSFTFMGAEHTRRTWFVHRQKSIVTAVFRPVAYRFTPGP